LNKDKALQIISCGPGLSAINSKHGRSSEWVRDIVKNRISDIDIVNIYEGHLPSCNAGDVCIITGSRYSVYDKIDWIKSFNEHIKKGVRNKVTMLGICFGHQILCNALGGEVANNEAGWEIGSSKVQLTKKGESSELFEGFSVDFSVYQSHHDAVISTPSNVEVLAQNQYGIQAFSCSDRIFGVQFHPEFSFNVMKAYHSIRIKKINNGREYFVYDENEGAKVINNFIDMTLRR
jgi:GMP synthase (glutamine-hydrolysing)